MTACRAGWHNSVTPDREATNSRWFLFCFKCLWPLPQQRVSKCSFCNLLWFHSPHFYINPESEGLNKSEGFTVLQSVCPRPHSIAMSGGLKVASSRTLQAWDHAQDRPRKGCYTEVPDDCVFSLVCTTKENVSCLSGSQLHYRELIAFISSYCSRKDGKLEV